MVVRQSISGQCSNNSNGEHATLLKVQMIIIVIIVIIIVVIILVLKMICYGIFKVEFVYFIFAINYILLCGNITYTISPTISINIKFKIIITSIKQIYSWWYVMH